MAKVWKAFLIRFQSDVTYIAINGFAMYTLVYGGDPLYKKIVFTLLQYLDKTNDPAYALPPDTHGWEIDTFCQWCYNNLYNFTGQNIPSVYADAYNSCMEPTRPDGSLKQRSRFHIDDACTGKQQLVRRYFKQAAHCFKHQLPYRAITNPVNGPKSRGYWFNAALGSGLFYYDYFMKQTLNILFGPQVHDQYPFAGTQIPPWCPPSVRCEQWTYHPISPIDFVFTIHNVVLPPLVAFLEFYIMAEPDYSMPTPGDPNLLWCRVGAQGLDINDEATGPIAYFTFPSLGPGWRTNTIAFHPGAATVKVYISVELQNGVGDYILSFRDFGIENSASVPQLMIYGTEGDAFGWEIGTGGFAFKQFADY